MLEGKNFWVFIGLCSINGIIAPIDPRVSMLGFLIYILISNYMLMVTAYWVSKNVKVITMKGATMYELQVQLIDKGGIWISVDHSDGLWGFLYPSSYDFEFTDKDGSFLNR